MCSVIELSITGTNFLHTVLILALLIPLKCMFCLKRNREPYNFKIVIVIVGVIWQKPVLTNASRVRETLLVSVNSVNIYCCSDAMQFKLRFYCMSATML